MYFGASHGRARDGEMVSELYFPVRTNHVEPYFVVRGLRLGVYRDQVEVKSFRFEIGWGCLVMVRIIDEIIEFSGISILSTNPRVAFKPASGLCYVTFHPGGNSMYLQFIIRGVFAGNCP